MIAPEQVAQTLVPWLGSAFLSCQESMCAQAAWLMYTWQPQRESLAHLVQQLDNLLFMAVHGHTQGRMALEMDNSQLIRLRTGDFAMMADELLYLQLEKMERNSYHQAIIREYAMRSGSLSALRALYLLYRDLQTPEETDTLRRVITACHEPWRTQQWLEAEE